MDIKELKRLVRSGESDWVEFKKTTGQRTAAAKTVCAFLNHKGGHVLFGVTDAGEIAGQDSGKKTLEDLSMEFNRIDPPVTPDITVIRLESGKSVIAVSVKKGEGPYTFDGRPYERTGTVTQVMPREAYERRLLEGMHPRQRWENQPAPDGIKISDLDEEEIRTMITNAALIGRMEAPRNMSVKSILRGLELMQDNRILNAAVVLFGRGVWADYPQCEIRLARFRGPARDGDFVDNRQYNGNAFSLLRRAEAFLLDHVPIAGRVVPGKMIRQDKPWYPPYATREALANAICHRDYSIPGGAVSLAMHNDRIEIANPGEFHFGITPAKLIKPHESRPWNPLIANAFYRAGIIERWGSGTTNILNWCNDNGNPNPHWQERAGSVVVTFLPIPESKTAQVTPQVTGEVTVQVGTKLALSRHQVEILEMCRNDSQLTELMTICGRTDRTKFRHQVLNPLIDSGLLEMTIPDKPRSSKQRYRLTQKGKEWLEKNIVRGK